MPKSVSLRDLGRYIGNWILRPLVFYARTAPYPSILAKSRVGRVELAFQSAPNTILPQEMAVGALDVKEGDALIALSDIHTLHCLMKKIKEEEKELTIETVTLSWGATPRDLDIHFLIQHRDKYEHIWYRNLGNLEEYPWAKLGADITTGFGPEVLSFGLLAKGRYTVAVHNFSGESQLAGCGAIINLELRGESRVFRCPKEGIGRYWLVFELDVESGKLKEFNTLTDNIDNLIKK